MNNAFVKNRRNFKFWRWTRWVRMAHVILNIKIAYFSNSKSLLVSQKSPLIKTVNVNVLPWDSATIYSRYVFYSTTLKTLIWLLPLSTFPVKTGSSLGTLGLPCLLCILNTCTYWWINELDTRTGEFCPLLNQWYSMVVKDSWFLP